MSGASGFAFRRVAPAGDVADGEVGNGQTLGPRLPEMGAVAVIELALFRHGQVHRIGGVKAFPFNHEGADAGVLEVLVLPGNLIHAASLARGHRQ